MRRILTIFLLLVILISSTNAGIQFHRKSPRVSKPPKNIILLIGDGMGTTQVYAGYTAKNGIMNITGMPVS